MQTHIRCKQRRDRPLLVSAQQGEEAQIQSGYLEIPGAAAVTASAAFGGATTHERPGHFNSFFLSKTNIDGFINVQSALHSSQVLGEVHPCNSSTDRLLTYTTHPTFKRGRDVVLSRTIRSENYDESIFIYTAT